MRRQLELLFEVQRIDTNIKQSEALQKKFIDDMTRLDEEFNQEEERRNLEQQKMENLEKDHRNHERLLRALEEQKKKIEERIMSLKTNREYQAGLHEIETVKGSISKQEDEILVLMEALEAVKASLKQSESSLKTSKTHYEEKKKRLEQDLQAYLRTIDEQRQKRELLVQKIDPGILADYKRIEKVRRGLAVALADNEQCLGCSMKIPPQIYNEVVLSEKLITCPNCQRILFVERTSVKQPDCDR